MKTIFDIILIVIHCFSTFCVPFYCLNSIVLLMLLNLFFMLIFFFILVSLNFGINLIVFLVIVIFISKLTRTPPKIGLERRQ